MKAKHQQPGPKGHLPAALPIRLLGAAFLRSPRTGARPRAKIRQKFGRRRLSQAAEAAPPRRFSVRALTAMNPASERRTTQWAWELGSWVQVGEGEAEGNAEGSARVSVVSAPASRVLMEPEDSPEPEARRLEEVRALEQYPASRSTITRRSALAFLRVQRQPRSRLRWLI